TRSRRCETQLALRVLFFVPPPPLTIAAVFWTRYLTRRLHLELPKGLEKLAIVAGALGRTGHANIHFPDCNCCDLPGSRDSTRRRNSRVEALYLYVLETARSIQESPSSLSPPWLNTDPGGSRVQCGPGDRTSPRRYQKLTANLTRIVANCRCGFRKF